MNRSGSSPRDLVILTVVGCLGLAAVGGFGGAVSCQVANRQDCGEAWKAGVAGALMAATTGGTLLAQLDGRRRNEEAVEPLPRRPGEG
jgi:hypothetical protein